MNTITSQVNALRNQLGLLSDVSKAEVLIADYREIGKKLQPLLHELRDLGSRLLVLDDLPEFEGVDRVQVNSISDQYRTASAAFETLLSTWQRKENKILQDEALGKAIVSIEGLVALLSDQMRSVWSSWCASILLRTIIEEAELETQSVIPGCEHIPSEYVRLSSELKGLIKVIPSSIEVVERIMGLVERLEQLRSQMRSGIPEAVERLFRAMRAIGSSGRAPLKLLTAEVIDWLEKNGHLDKYVIMRKQ